MFCSPWLKRMKQSPRCWKLRATSQWRVRDKIITLLQKWPNFYYIRQKWKIIFLNMMMNNKYESILRTFGAHVWFACFVFVYLYQFFTVELQPVFFFYLSYLFCISNPYHVRDWEEFVKNICFWCVENTECKQLHFVFFVLNIYFLAVETTIIN